MRTTLVSLILIATSTACYQYVPLDEAAPPPETGDEVRLRLNSPQSLEMGSVTVNDITVLEGNVHEANGDISLLGGMRSLTYLNIKHTRVSLTGLTQLGELTRLYVDHRHSRVSDVDAQRLADRFGWTSHGACSCGCLDIEPRR